MAYAGGFLSCVIGISLPSFADFWYRASRIYIMYSCYLRYYQKKKKSWVTSNFSQVDWLSNKDEFMLNPTHLLIKVEKSI